MTGTQSLSTGGVNDAALLSTLAERSLPIDNVIASESQAQPGTVTSLFNDMLSRVQAGTDQPGGHNQGPAGEEDKKLREAAEMFVSTSMIMPLFQQLRNDPLAAKLIDGGRAESIFQQQLDQILSDRIASATRFDVVDAVYNQLHQTAMSRVVNTNA